MLRKTAEDFLLAVAVKADDEVDTGRPEAVIFFDLDVLSIEEDGKQVGVDGSGVDELEFFEVVIDEASSE